MACKTAGSFRWERFVKSSLASSIEGFISGGRAALLSLSAASVVSIVLTWRWHTLSVHDGNWGARCTVSINIPRRSPEQTPVSHSLRQQSFAPPRRQPNPQSSPAAMPWFQHRRCATWLNHDQARASGYRMVTAQSSSRCSVNLLVSCSAAQEWK
jgi:hypothetical protein